MTEKRNIFPDIKSDLWSTENSDLKALAKYSKDIIGDGLIISLDSKSYGVGKWVINTPVIENHNYEVSVIAETKSELNDVYAIIFFLQ